MPAIPHFIEPDWPAPANVLALSTSRQGGCSAAPFASLNLGHHVGDSATAVAANRGIVAAALPAGTAIEWLSQVHGTRVVEAGRGREHPRADAVWSRQVNRACAVLTADCLPVLFCSTSGDRVAAAHAGWRGLLDGVLEATVAAMGVDSEKILAWMGPAIGPRVFEVGAEVREQYLAAASATDKVLVEVSFVPSEVRPGHYFADLYALARLRLRAVGVTGVFGGGYCTFSDAGRFFSYRRDGRTGRMASLILMR